MTSRRRIALLMAILLTAFFCAAAEDEDLVEAVLPFVKWIGTLRNRGFGNVRIEIEVPEKGDRAENGGADA